MPKCRILSLSLLALAPLCLIACRGPISMRLSWIGDEKARTLLTRTVENLGGSKAWEQLEEIKTTVIVTEYDNDGLSTVTELHETIWPNELQNIHIYSRTAEGERFDKMEHGFVDVFVNNHWRANRELTEQARYRLNRQLYSIGLPMTLIDFNANISYLGRTDVRRMSVEKVRIEHGEGNKRLPLTDYTLYLDANTNEVVGIWAKAGPPFENAPAFYLVPDNFRDLGNGTMLATRIVGFYGDPQGGRTPDKAFMLEVIDAKTTLKGGKKVRLHLEPR